MSALLGIVMVSVAAVAFVIGFAVWDYHKTLKPLLERSEARRLKKIEQVLKMYARVEPRFAEVSKREGWL